MSQSGAARRNMTNGYAKMGGSLQRPRISGVKNRSVKEAIAAAARTAARMANSRKAKK